MCWACTYILSPDYVYLVVFIPYAGVSELAKGAGLKKTSPSGLDCSNPGGFEKSCREGVRGFESLPPQTLRKLEHRTQRVLSGSRPEGIGMTETARYEVLKKIGDVEIRRYPDLILASTNLKSADENSAFGILAGYIFGDNSIGSRISMTSPVITSERIGMTTPVITRKDRSDYTMSFVMPSKYSLETLPKPNAGEVKIEVQKSRTIAVLRFSGFTNLKKVEKMQQILIDTLNSRDIKIRPPPFLMRYNSPWSLPIIRRNEVGVEVIGTL
jgi:hypothetical protein